MQRPTEQDCSKHTRHLHCCWSETDQNNRLVVVCGGMHLRYVVCPLYLTFYVLSMQSIIAMPFRRHFIAFPRSLSHKIFVLSTWWNFS